MKRTVFFGLGAIVLSGSAMAQVSVSAGTYFPTNSTVKTIFGDSPVAYGFGFGRADRANREGMSADVLGISLNSSGNKFFALGATYGLEAHSGKGTATMTYYRIGTGLAYFDYDINASPYIFRGNSIRSISSAEVGVVISNSFTLSAQYMLIPKIGGLDFSGLRLQAMFTIGKF